MNPTGKIPCHWSLIIARGGVVWCCCVLRCPVCRWVCGVQLRSVGLVAPQRSSSDDKKSVITTTTLQHSHPPQPITPPQPTTPPRPDAVADEGSERARRSRRAARGKGWTEERDGGKDDRKDSAEDEEALWSGGYSAVQCQGVYGGGGGGGVSAECGDLILSPYIPHCEGDVLILDGFYVESDGGDGGDDFSQLEFIEDGRLTRCIQSHHENAHLLLTEHPTEDLTEGQTHPDRGRREGAEKDWKGERGKGREGSRKEREWREREVVTLRRTAPVQW